MNKVLNKVLHKTLLGVLAYSLISFSLAAQAQQDQAQQDQAQRYKLADVYIIGLDKLDEPYIQRYLRENGILLGAELNQKTLERRAVVLREIALQDPALLSLDLFFIYDGQEVYVEVLVSEMSLDFIPGGGNTYARFGWANRIRPPSLVELAIGYNRQDIYIDLPYLARGIFGLDFRFGHRIWDHWDFSELSRIRSNAFFEGGTYIKPLTWFKLGVGLQAGLLYFYRAPEQFSDSRAADLRKAQSLGLGAKLEEEGLGEKLHGNVALKGRLVLDRKYLAKEGLGWYIALESRYEFLGLFAAQQGLYVDLGLVTEPLSWLRSSLELRGAWHMNGLLPLDSEVFSSKQQGYLRSAAELRILFMPIHINDPLVLDIGLNLGAIVGFASMDIDLARDLELSLFAGPEFAFGMPVNVRGQFDFGLIFKEQFTKIDFAFHFRIF